MGPATCQRALPAWPAALSLIIWLAGCATTPPVATPPGPERTTEAPNAIDVAVVERKLTLHVPMGTAAREAEAWAPVDALLASGDLGRGDLVVIDSAPGEFAAAQAASLAAALTRQGLRVTLNPARGAAGGELRLVIQHAVAVVPHCPNWSKPPGNDAANTLHSDFGCATAMDLAAMVADSRDLIQGELPAPGVVGDAALTAMHKYRTGKGETNLTDSPSSLADSASNLADSTSALANSVTTATTPP